MEERVIGSAVAPSEALDGDRPVEAIASHRVVHVHVPKTAGTAIRTAFSRHYSKERVFSSSDERDYFNVDPNDYSFFSGHIGFKAARRLEGELITVLRNPVDRFLSVYYFWKELGERQKELNVKTKIASAYSIDEFALITDVLPLTEALDDRMTFQLALGASLAERQELRASGLTRDQIFSLAVRNLETFKIVGIQERMGQFTDQIRELYGIRLNVRRVNVTKERLSASDISVNTLRVIQNRVAMDLELYFRFLNKA